MKTALVVTAAAIGAIVIGAAISNCTNTMLEADRVAACSEGKFQYQVLADCSKINGCSFGPEELAYVRNLRQNCREGE